MIPDDVIKGADILVVDDDPATVELIRRMLERAGYARIRSTTDPTAVTGLVETREPDIILLDLLMPKVDGFGVLDALRDVIPEGAYLPIIVLTGDDRPEPRLRALVAGAKDFLTKPFDQFEVMLRIHNLLEARFLFRTLTEAGRNPARSRQVTAAE